MKVLIFGGSGQLGYELRRKALDLNFEVATPVQSEVNISSGPQVQFLVSQVKPDVIINSAAYTAVDKAEEEPEKAFAINRDGVRHIAHAAKSLGIRVIHVSTDYVFNGEYSAPISEQTPTQPINIYGQSKLEGENAILEILGDKALVVRTSSLHGQRGINFVATMLKLFAEREVVKVVDDQFMSPTYAGWLADVLLDLSRIECSGVLHASGKGSVSWYHFAEEIMRLSRGKLPKQVARLETTSAAAFGRPAKRPRYSVFDCSKLSSILKREPISWQEGLRTHLADIGMLAEG